MADFEIIDRRGTNRTSSLQTTNLDSTMSRLRKSGATLPHSPTMARAEAHNVEVAMQNRTLTDAMRRQRAEARRQAMGNSGAMTRVASDLAIALPKVREPGSTLAEMGVPTDFEDEEGLAEIRRWARLFSITHDLVPLLIAVYSRFPVIGLEFKCTRDKLITDFYTDLFMDKLHYDTFLPDVLGNEFFTVGEVNVLGHFNESLGIWSSEEVLNPDQLRVTGSMFVKQERVQLMFKDLVDNLKNGPTGADKTKEPQSQREQRMRDLQMLTEAYPEIIAAAQTNDGLDISEAKLCRLVNQPTPWSHRGIPFLMRSFATLMREESLNAAQNAVADRLQTPLILATVGVPDLGDGEPWIPEKTDLQEVREDLQNAFAADFRLMVHNFGVQIQSVFGREAIPRFDQDYDRIDKKLMQAWGIGEALIAGGTGAAGTYASSALNRELISLMMKGYQARLTQYITKRMEIVAEAQEHYDFEKKGPLRIPKYREVVEEDPETGEQRIVRRPKLLVPDIEWKVLGLQDEAMERAFLQQLKAMGVPISDQTLVTNIPFEPQEELERSATEAKNKMMVTARMMRDLQKECDDEGLPYPADLVAHLTATLQLRQGKAGTEIQEAQAELTGDQAEMQRTQIEQAMEQMTAPPQQMGGPQQALPPGQGQQMTAAAFPTVSGPSASPMPSPRIPGTEDGTPDDVPNPTEVPRNRTRPPISDEQRGRMPKEVKKGRNGKVNGHAPTGKLARVVGAPSSYGHADRATMDDAERAVRRLDVIASHEPVSEVEQLVDSDEFWQVTSMSPYADQVRADLPEILAGGARESRDILVSALEIYTEMFGVVPEWTDA